MISSQLVHATYGIEFSNVFLHILKILTYFKSRSV